MSCLALSRQGRNKVRILRVSVSLMQSRRLIEILGLQEWQPNFAYHEKLHKLLVGDQTTWFRYIQPSSSKHTRYICQLVPVLPFGNTQEVPVARSLYLKIDPRKLNYDDIERLVPDTPASFPHKMSHLNDKHLASVKTLTAKHKVSIFIYHDDMSRYDRAFLWAEATSTFSCT